MKNNLIYPQNNRHVFLCVFKSDRSGKKDFVNRYLNYIKNLRLIN